MIASYKRTAGSLESVSLSIMHVVSLGGGLNGRQKVTVLFVCCSVWYVAPDGSPKAGFERDEGQIVLDRDRCTTSDASMEANRKERSEAQAAVLPLPTRATHVDTGSTRGSNELFLRCPIFDWSEHGNGQSRCDLKPRSRSSNLKKKKMSEQGWMGGRPQMARTATGWAY